jgi:hypothetical protein
MLNAPSGGNTNGTITIDRAVGAAGGNDPPRLIRP